jgi:iron complex transport system substrate-binding protein
VRVVSLLPATTEIVAAIGGTLVGVSHECDHPVFVRDLPRVTRARVGPIGSSRAIHEGIEALLRSALAIYDLDGPLLRELGPDLVVTQDLCAVCAVSRPEVDEAVRTWLGRPAAVLTTNPHRLRDVFEDVERIGRAIDRRSEADRLIFSLRARCDRVGSRASAAAGEPRVLALEWIEPFMIAGLWMPELIELAGGRSIGPRPGEKARVATVAELAALDPEIVIVKPCGFDLARTIAEQERLCAILPIDRWRSLRSVFLADGNAYFNRPGPRLVDSLEIIAELIHPEIFPRSYADAYLELQR